MFYDQSYNTFVHTLFNHIVLLCVINSISVHKEELERSSRVGRAEPPGAVRARAVGEEEAVLSRWGEELLWTAVQNSEPYCRKRKRDWEVKGIGKRLDTNNINSSFFEVWRKFYRNQDNRFLSPHIKVRLTYVVSTRLEHLFGRCPQSVRFRSVDYTTQFSLCDVIKKSMKSKESFKIGGISTYVMATMPDSWLISGLCTAPPFVCSCAWQMLDCVFAFGGDIPLKPQIIMRR